MDIKNDLISEVEAVNSICIKPSKIEKPFVTIAIPTYKRTDLLIKAVESALGQVGFDNYEVIVVDNDPERDCATERALSKYADRDNFAYYKNSENVGMSGNLNKLYLLSKSEYVVMLHDDDMLYPDFLKHIFNDYWHLIKDYSLVFPPFCSHDWYRDNYDGESLLQDVSINDFVFHNFIGPPIGLIVKKDVWRRMGGFDDAYFPSIDYDFYVKSLASGLKAVKIYDKPLAFYNLVGNTSASIMVYINAVTKSGPKILADFSKSYKPILRYIIKKAKKTTMRVRLELINESHKSSDIYKDKLAELRNDETTTSKIYYKLLHIIDNKIMKVSRRLRRRKIQKSSI